MACYLKLPAVIIAQLVGTLLLWNPRLWVVFDRLASAFYRDLLGWARNCSDLGFSSFKPERLASSVLSLCFNS